MTLLIEWLVMSALGQKQTSETGDQNVCFTPESGHCGQCFGTSAERHELPDEAAMAIVGLPLSGCNVGATICKKLEVRLFNRATRLQNEDKQPEISNFVSLLNAVLPGSTTMNADDMTHCSMIAAYHQMTNARSGRWHHFDGDPLFGRIAGDNCQDAVRHHPASERQPYRAIPALPRFGRVLHIFGLHRPN